jgi:hypothetical protein
MKSGWTANFFEFKHCAGTPHRILPGRHWLALRAGLG